MFGADVVLAVLAAVPSAVVDGGWGVDALAGRVTRDHDDLDLVVPAAELDAILDALGLLGFTAVHDERPTRVEVLRPDGLAVDLHLVEAAPSGTVQRLPGGRQFTYVLDGTTGHVDGHEVPCVSAAMQLLTHTGYEPGDDDRRDVELAAAVGGLALPPPFVPPVARGEHVAVRDAVVEDVPAACMIRIRSWRAAYTGLMPDAVIDALDLGTMWATWQASVREPPSAVHRLLVAGRPGEVHAYAWVGPGEVRALYADPTAWGTRAGHEVFTVGVEFLREHGFDELELWMLKGNLRAARFYERAGWRPDGAERTTTTPVGSYVEVRYRP